MPSHGGEALPGYISLPGFETHTHTHAVECECVCAVTRRAFYSSFSGVDVREIPRAQQTEGEARALALHLALKSKACISTFHSGD